MSPRHSVPEANESLKDYIARFMHEVSNIEDPSDESVLTAISTGLREDEKLYENIYRTPIRDLGEFYNYCVLSDPQERIFAMERNKKEFGKPNLLRTPNKFKNREKFCAYHNEAGHNTSECLALKDVIEDLIRRGRLRDYVV